MTGHDLVQLLLSSRGGLGVLCAMILIAVGARRFLPPDRSHRGRTPIVLLLSAAVVRLLVTVAPYGDPLWAGMTVLFVLLLMLGTVSLLALIVFDVVLARSQRYVPAILRDLVQAVVFFLIALLVLRRAGVDLVSLLTTSAVLGAVIGLASQSTLANLFAGLALQLDRTFSVGEWIRVGSLAGRIEEIKWRATSLVTSSGDRIIVPNSTLVTNDVLNLSRPRGAHQARVNVGFHYRHPPNVVRAIVLDTLRGTPGVLEAPAPDCFLADFGENAIVYAVRFWITDLGAEESIGGEVRARIWYAASRTGLEIPGPTATLVFPSSEDAPSDPRAELGALLARIDVLAPFDESERAQLGARTRRQLFGAGEVIVRQGDPGDSLFLIQEGEVGVSVAADGASGDLATLQAGQFFGEMSLLTGEARRATCTARTDVACFVVERAALAGLLAGRQEVAAQMAAVLEKRRAQLGDQVRALAAAAHGTGQETGARLLERMRAFLRI